MRMDAKLRCYDVHSHFIYVMFIGTSMYVYVNDYVRCKKNVIIRQVIAQGLTLNFRMFNLINYLVIH